jgi:arylsulfatase A-like enzyme
MTDIPQPQAPFAGKIERNYKDSTPAYPDGVQAPAGAPNILMILLDDIGFGQAGVSGGPVPTPNMDALAGRGTKYTRFHTTSLCSPTRAALLTGRNHHRVGFGTIVEGSTGYPGYNCALPPSAATIGKTLTINGYNTAWFGKNHNTPDWESSAAGPFDRWPTGLGFEYFYGFNGGETSQFEPQLYENITPVEAPSAPDYHLTEDLTTRARTWITQQKSLAPDKPFFVYFATGAVHAPHHVPREHIDRFAGQFGQGWDVVREETLARQKKIGVAPEHADLTGRPAELPSWDSASADERRLYARMQEVFAGFVAHTDEEIGRLVSVLDDLDITEDTLVILIVGDNGPSAEGGLTGTINNMATQNGLPDTVANILPHIDELGSKLHENHYPVGWAWAGAAPFQWTKQVASHFGGTRNLAAMTWPGHIEADAIRTQFHHVIDIVPTILDVAGIDVPAHVDGIEQISLDGVSMAYTFPAGAATEGDRRTTQYFEHGGNRAIYHDGWMAAARHGVPWQLLGKQGDFDADTWELYHLDDDFSQAHDLAAQQPAKLSELKDLFDTQAWANNVYPLDDRFAERAYDPLRPSMTRGKNTFVYRSGTTRITAGTAAPTNNVSHRITARIAVPDHGGSGVIIANGGRAAGYALYLRNQRLVYEYNYFDRSRTVVTSSIDVPAGDIEVAMEFLADKDHAPGTGGIIRIAIDNKTVGEGRAETTVPGRFSATETLDIGFDLGGPVSTNYESPNPFTGTIEWVKIELTATPTPESAQKP